MTTSDSLSKETTFAPENEQWDAKVDDYGYSYGRPYITVDDGCHTVCAVFTNDERGKSVPHFVEKARLIAAAPELYWAAFEAQATMMRTADLLQQLGRQRDAEHLRRAGDVCLGAMLKAREVNER